MTAVIFLKNDSLAIKLKKSTESYITVNMYLHISQFPENAPKECGLHLTRNPSSLPLE